MAHKELKMERVYFAHLEINHYKRNRICVKGPEFNSRTEAEQNLHQLTKKFEPCIDSDEWITGRSVWERILPEIDIENPPTFRQWLSQEDGIKMVMEYPPYD